MKKRDRRGAHYFPRENLEKGSILIGYNPKCRKEVKQRRKNITWGEDTTGKARKEKGGNPKKFKEKKNKESDRNAQWRAEIRPQSAPR